MNIEEMKQIIKNKPTTELEATIITISTSDIQTEEKTILIELCNSKLHRKNNMTQSMIEESKPCVEEFEF